MKFELDAVRHGLKQLQDQEKPGSALDALDALDRQVAPTSLSVGFLKCKMRPTALISHCDNSLECCASLTGVIQDTLASLRFPLSSL